MELIADLKNAGIVKNGEFILKSGIKSSVYFNFKSLIAYPKIMSDICFALSKLVSINTVIAGVPMGAVPYATLISHIKQLPMISIRGTPKNYGACPGQQIEGIVNNSKQGSGKITLIEDVITTGSSVLETAQLLENNGHTIDKIICILDREAGGMADLRSLGYKCEALLTMSDFTETSDLTSNQICIRNFGMQDLVDTANLKKTNLIVSLDICDLEYFIIALDEIADHICAVKIHYDIFTGVTEDLISRFNTLRIEKNFMVIEDRKFADIAAISIKQFENMKQIIQPDLITVHGICGDDFIKYLAEFHPEVGVILVHQLSVIGNLIDRTYSNYIVDMAKRCKNVVGFVSQERPLQGYLIFTPGISLTADGDKMGQRYKNPDDTNHADFIIVGRGIYEAQNMLEATMKYKQFYKKIESIDYHHCTFKDE